MIQTIVVPENTPEATKKDFYVHKANLTTHIQSTDDVRIDQWEAPNYTTIRFEVPYTNPLSNLLVDKTAQYKKLARQALYLLLHPCPTTSAPTSSHEQLPNYPTELQ